MALGYLHYSERNIFGRIGLDHTKGIQEILKQDNPSLQKEDCLFIYAYSTNPPESPKEYKYRQNGPGDLPFGLHKIDLTSGRDIQLATSKVVDLIGRNLYSRKPIKKSLIKSSGNLINMKHNI